MTPSRRAAETANPMFGIDGPEFYFGVTVSRDKYVSFVQSVQVDCLPWGLKFRAVADDKLKDSRLEVELGHGWESVAWQSPAITDPFGNNTYRIMPDKWLGIQAWLAKDVCQ